MFVTNTVAVISNLHVDVCAFFCAIIQFCRVPLSVLVRALGGTPNPGWELLRYAVGSLGPWERYFPYPQ
jgi:hypothetical protein